MIDLVVLLALCWCMSSAIYRLYFSPLAKFPGNRVAALTLWYEFYYQVVKGGQYPWKVQEMHKKYGISTRPYSIPSLISH